MFSKREPLQRPAAVVTEVGASASSLVERANCKCLSTYWWGEPHADGLLDGVVLAEFVFHIGSGRSFDTLCLPWDAGEWVACVISRRRCAVGFVGGGMAGQGVGLDAQNVCMARSGSSREGALGNLVRQLEERFIALNRDVLEPWCEPARSSPCESTGGSGDGELVEFG